MEDIRIVKKKTHSDCEKDIFRVFVYGFAGNYQDLISAVVKTQEFSPFPVNIIKFDDVFVVSTDYQEFIYNKGLEQ